MSTLIKLAGFVRCFSRFSAHANPGPLVVFGREQIQAPFEAEYLSGARILGFETVQADGDGEVAWAFQRSPINIGDTVFMIALRRDEAGWKITSETVTA